MYRIYLPFCYLTASMKQSRGQVGSKGEGNNLNYQSKLCVITSLHANHYKNCIDFVNG